jgi:hypothetical protein
LVQLRHEGACSRRKDRIFKDHGLVVDRVTSEMLDKEPIAVTGRSIRTIAACGRRAA